MAKGPLEISQVQRLLRWVKLKDREQVERKLCTGVLDLIDLTDPEEGICALHLASTEGDLGMVHLLLSKKAHCDIRDKKGRTAMMLAAERGHTNVVKLLASHQADTTLVDDEGKGALFTFPIFVHLEYFYSLFSFLIELIF